MAKRRRKKAWRRWSLPRLPQWNVPWPSVGRAVTITAWVAAAGGLVTAWVLGVPRLEAYAVKHQPAAGVQVRLLDVPPWVGPQLERSLLETAARSIGPDPFRRTDLVDAREALLGTGWFVSVEQVRRVGPLLVEVTATAAEPLAVIQDPAGRQHHLVDAQGRLLPRTFQTAEQAGYITITGVQYDRPARSGMMWPGNDVTAALELVALIIRKPWQGQVARVDVARHWKDGSIRLITDRGCTITWGRAPGDEAGGDVPALQKLSYLDYHHDQYGHIDRGLEELDITGDVVVGR